MRSIDVIMNNYLRQSRSFACQVVGLIVICFSAAVLTASADEQQVVRVGYMLDLSAKGAFIGVQSKAGAELAAKEISSQEFRVELIFEDHRTEGARGASLAHKLITVDDVDGVLCDLTPPCVAAAAVSQQHKKPFLYQAPADSIRRNNSWAFQNFLDYEAGCEAIARHWRSEGINEVAHFKVNAEFGELCVEGMTRVFPRQRLIEYDAGSEMRTMVLGIAKKNVDRVMQTGYEGDYVQRLRAMQELRLFKPSAMPQPLLTPLVLQSVAPSLIEGMLVFGFPEISSRFVSALRDAGLYQSSVSIESAAIAYQHVYELAHAVKKCGRAHVECQRESIEQSREGGIALGFKGWVERKARYPIVLRRWNGSVSALEPVVEGSPS